MKEIAKQFAINAHKGQYRKYTGEDYVVHPISVAQHVQKYFNDDDMICAAYLHDVVEDTDYELNDLLDYGFSAKTVDLVRELTKVSTHQDGSRAARKAKDHAFLATVSDTAKTIKFFDILDNLPSIIQSDPDFAETYVPEVKVLIELLKQGGDIRMYNMVTRIIQNYEKTI